MPKLTFLTLLVVCITAAAVYAHYHKSNLAAAAITPSPSPSASPTFFTSPTPTSSKGILQGDVSIGPNCPVEQVGNPCTPTPEQYTSQTIIVSDASTKVEVMRIHPDRKGHYSVNLDAGNYSIVAEAYQNNPNNQTVTTISVQAGQTTTLDLSIDTGIR